MFYKTDKISILIDGHGLSLVSRALDMQVDFRKLLKEFSRRGKLVHAQYYMTVEENSDYNGIQKLLDYLSYNGFIVKTNPVRKYADSKGNVRAKGNMAVDIAVDAFEIARHVDHLVLFIADGDITPLVERLKRLGVKVTVCASKQGDGFTLSRELRGAADNFIELEALRSLIGRDEPELPPSSTGHAKDQHDQAGPQ